MTTCAISVIIPCYNTERWIAGAIQSVFDQNYDDLEIIVVDDGSADNSLEVARSFSDRVTVLSGPNRGACHARNCGLMIARGEFVLFLDADDCLHGPYLRQMADHVTPDVDVVVGAHAEVNASGEVSKVQFYSDIDSPEELLAAYLMDYVQTGGFLWRREALIAAGGWNESLPISQDAELAIRMLLRRKPFALAKLDGAYAVWRIYDGPRITAALSLEKLRAMLSALTMHKVAMASLGNPRVDRGLAMRFYRFAVVAFACSCNGLGRTALEEAKALGMTDHPGSFAHQLSSTVLGLELKTRLAAIVHKLLVRFGHRPPPFPYSMSASVRFFPGRPA